ncbi:MAG TPA: PP2C family protein-serine/threonine phosphatase [Solirubrobacteraceae bacterium]|nr:PP2C family protein-serine/threonine phosphatase [Solirubrobacteraceae bacterium]
MSRRAVAVTASCCALGLAFIPVATAKRDHDKSSAATSSGQTSTQTAQTRSETASTATTTTTTAPAAQAKRHGGAGHKHARAGTGESSSSATSGEASGKQTPEAQLQSAASPGLANPAARKFKHKEGKKEGKEGKKEGKGGSAGKHGKGKTEEKSGQEKTGEKTEQKTEEAKGSPAPTPALTAPPASEALAPATTAPATPTPLGAAGVSTPVRVADHGRLARKRAHSRRSAGAGAAAVSAGRRSAALLPALAGAVRHTRRARHPVAAPPHGTGGPVAPLVKTITKIVAVVPMAVRALIAGLLALALALAVRSRVAAVRARRLEHQRRDLLDDVGLLQAALLPATPSRIGDVDVSVAYQPAAGPGAGGDFYDVFALDDDRLAVIVGDISGHGRQALPHTALVRFTLRAYLEAGLSPRDALQTAGAVLERQLGGVFATVVAAVYEPRERVLVYACAGHPPPLVLGAQPGADSLAPVTICTSPPIGVGMRTGTRQTTVSLPGCAQICFYTDGVTEARVGAELFGLERLADAMAELGPHASAEELLARVAEHVDARPDDMAACVLTVAGAQAPPRTLVEELEIDRREASSARTDSFLRACGIARARASAVTGAAGAAAGRAGTVVLEVRRGEHAEVSLRREQLTHLHARRMHDTRQADAQEAL